MKYDYDVEFDGIYTTILVILQKYDTLLCSFSYDGVNNCMSDVSAYCNYKYYLKFRNKLFKTRDGKTYMSRFCNKVIAKCTRPKVSPRVRGGADV